LEHKMWSVIKTREPVVVRQVYHLPLVHSLQRKNHTFCLFCKPAWFFKNLEKSTNIALNIQINEKLGLKIKYRKIAETCIKNVFVLNVNIMKRIYTSLCDRFH